MRRQFHKSPSQLNADNIYLVYTQNFANYQSLSAWWWYHVQDGTDILKKLTNLHQWNRTTYLLYRKKIYIGIISFAISLMANKPNFNSGPFCFLLHFLNWLVVVQSPRVSHFRGPLPPDHAPVDHGGAGGVRNDIQLQSTCAISVYKSIDLYWYSKNSSSFLTRYHRSPRP